MLFSIVFILPLLITADSKKKRSKSKIPIHFNLTVNDYLRVYVTERTPPPVSGESEEYREFGDEIGTPKKLLNLDGSMRQKFAFEAISTDPRVSVICSPFSAMMPLGIILFGAGNSKTEKELLNALGIHKKKEAHDYFQDLRRKIKRLDEIITHMATRIYIRDDQRIRSGFKHEVEVTFGSCIDTIDMKNPVHVASEVNKWVRRHTNDKITDIIRPGDVSPWTIVMVVDAFYFAGAWKHRFNNAQPENFYGASGKHKVNMMNKMQTYVYGTSKVLGAQAILIPYERNSASMLVILPHARDGLELVLRQLKLAPDLINKFKMKERYVDLYLPKFKIETSMDLKVLYQKVGLKEVFLEGAGLQDIVKDSSVKIDQGIQKSIIEVNEWGTVAASASMIQGVGAGNPMGIVTFKADHPFLFFIIAHKQQLFAGTFVG